MKFVTGSIELNYLYIVFVILHSLINGLSLLTKQDSFLSLTAMSLSSLLHSRSILFHRLSIYYYWIHW